MYESGEIPRSFFPLQYQVNYENGDIDNAQSDNENIRMKMVLETKKLEFEKERKKELEKGDDNSKKRESLDFLENKKKSNLYFLNNIIDKHNQVDLNCPRYVTMIPPKHGMGHQIGTYTSGLIVSLIFGLTFVEGGFKDDTYHGIYPFPGMGNFTGLHENELRYKDDKIIAVESSSTSTKSSISSEYEKKLKDVKVIQIDEQPTEPFDSNYYNAYQPLEKVFNEKYKNECNVLFKLKEFYSYDYGSFTKWIEANKFQFEAINRPPMKLIYDESYLNIAVHIRVGDIMPTKETFFVNVLYQVLQTLQDQQIPYRIYIFAEGQKQENFPTLAKFLQVYAAYNSFQFIHQTTPYESFYLLTQANIQIMAASGFSQMSALVGTKALQFSPPSREKFPLKYCPPGAVCCEADGYFDHGGIVRLQWHAYRWKMIKVLRNEIEELENSIKSL